MPVCCVSTDMKNHGRDVEIEPEFYEELVKLSKTTGIPVEKLTNRAVKEFLQENRSKEP